MTSRSRSEMLAFPRGLVMQEQKAQVVAEAGERGTSPQGSGAIWARLHSYPLRERLRLRDVGDLGCSGRAACGQGCGTL